MTIIANLDAAIDQHNAEVATTKKEIQIFGRVWPLIPTMTTAQLTPFMQLQAAAEIANDPARAQTTEAGLMAIQALTGLTDIFSKVIAEEHRKEFRAILDEKGIPLPILPQVIEAVMTAYDAAPFRSENSTSGSEPSHPTNTPLLGSTTASGNSPETAGSTSNSNFDQSPTPTPPAPEPQSPTLGSGRLQVAEQGETLQPYTPQTPPSLAAVPEEGSSQ